jgi:peptidoglycan/xylan/chitin deacetylase (PgdA/CDA1 family)
MLERELILTFHGLGEQIPRDATEAERKVWVPVEWFEAIVGALPSEGVTLAFDDGNASDAEHGLEVLTRLGRRARFFVLAKRVGTAGYLTERQLRELHDAGMTIGSHGLSHRDWRRLGDEELREELVGSRRALGELLGIEVDEAACPFGSYDRRVLRGLREAGYRRVYNSDGGSARVGAWMAPRNTVHRELELERWLTLAGAGPQAWPSPALAGKRLVKRLR